ncbi:hypothetical protein SLA2020_374250 [Shorea laevis]
MPFFSIYFCRIQGREYLLPVGIVLKSLIETNDHEIYVADAVLRDYIFVHLDDNDDKFNLLISMVQKLLSLIDQTCVPDNLDSLQNEEILLPGHIITIYLKEKLEDWLHKSKELLQDEINNTSKQFNFFSVLDVKKVMDKNPSKQISLSVENMLKTGRLLTQTGLDLQHVSAILSIQNFLTVKTGSMNPST